MFLKYNIPAILLFFVILFLCTLPGSKVPQYAIPHLDKIAHITLFGSFGLSMFYGFSKQFQFKKLQQKAVLIAFSFGIFYGIAIEIIQANFIPSRSFELEDIIADSAGILLALLFFRKVKSKLIE